MKIPFKTKGIYAYKIDPDKDLVNYKQTKLDNIWNAVVGKKEEAYYQIVCFQKDYSQRNFSTHSEEPDDSTERKFCATCRLTTGEIFYLADMAPKWRGGYGSEYGNVLFEGNRINFVVKEIPFQGFFDDDGDILYLKIGDSDNEKFRYVPWTSWLKKK